MVLCVEYKNIGSDSFLTEFLFFVAFLDAGIFYFFLIVALSVAKSVANLVALQQPSIFPLFSGFFGVIFGLKKGKNSILVANVVSIFMDRGMIEIKVFLIQLF